MQQCNSVALFSPFTGTYLCEWGFSFFFHEVLITVQLERFLFDLVRYKNSIEMENLRIKYEIDPFLNITDVGGNW